MGISINQVNEGQKITRTKKDALKTPNWSVIPTKGMQIPSDEELIEKIKNLAKREAVAKTNKEFEVIEEERKKLNAQFLSKVSPDRKSLSKGGYDYDIKANNNVVLGSINGNWTYSLTPAEQIRQDEFNKIYYNSCQCEKAERMRGVLRPSSYFKNSNVESNFDIKA